MAHVDVYNILSPIFGIAIYANCLILLKVRLLLCYKLLNKWSVVCFKFTLHFHRYLCSGNFFSFFKYNIILNVVFTYNTNYIWRKFHFFCFIINLKILRRERKKEEVVGLEIRSEKMTLNVVYWNCSSVKV